MQEEVVHIPFDSWPRAVKGLDVGKVEVPMRRSGVDSVRRGQLRFGLRWSRRLRRTRSGRRRAQVLRFGRAFVIRSIASRQRGPWVSTTLSFFASLSSSSLRWAFFFLPCRVPSTHYASSPLYSTIVRTQ